MLHNMKKAVQLYSIRLLCEKDMEAGLKKASEFGYQGVEFAGFFDHSADQVKSWLQQYNLEAMGAHVGEDLIFDKTDETIAFHKVIGNTRIICPWADLKTREDVIAFTDKIKAVAAKFKANGMQLYYHNHAHEFEKDNGEYLIDIMADATSKDELMFELDVYWVKRGGECPSGYMKKYADRMDIFHVKDGTETEGTPAGKGNVPLVEVFETAKEIGIKWAVIESEAESSAEIQVEDIKTCIDYVNTIM